MKKKRIAIIGGGISGLTAAYLFSKEKNYEVHIIEKNNSLGGLLNSFDYGEKYGRFDYGAHNILELKIKELDDFHLSLFPKDKWQKTTTINGQIRALSGLMYNRKLQENMPFIDLRSNPKLSEYIGDFFTNLNNQEKEKDAFSFDNAYEYSLYQFGQKITDEVIVPAIRKIHKHHPKDLSIMVMYLTQFSRIGLFNEHIMKELVHLKTVGSRLSYTEQQNLPEEYLVNAYSLYPKDYGIYRVIDAIENKLLENSVIIHKNSKVTNIKQDDNSIETLTINEDTNIEVDYVVNSAGYGVAAHLFNIDTKDYKFDQNPKTVITNILLDKPLQCGELCFINCYDENSKIFRVDNYINYCSGAKRNGFYPVSIESILFDEYDKEELQEHIIKELKDYNMIEEDAKIEFIRTEELEYGFPCLSTNNISIINDLRKKVDSLDIKNLINIGLLTQENLFFESDVIKNAYARIKKIINKGDTNV